MFIIIYNAKKLAITVHKIYLNDRSKKYKIFFIFPLQVGISLPKE